jgi:hypothetical protein
VRFIETASAQTTGAGIDIGTDHSLILDEGSVSLCAPYYILIDNINMSLLPLHVCDGVCEIPKHESTVVELSISRTCAYKLSSQFQDIRCHNLKTSNDIKGKTFIFG